MHKNSVEKKNPEALVYKASGSRSGGIRTRGLLVPKQQAAHETAVPESENYRSAKRYPPISPRAICELLRQASSRAVW